MGEQLGSLDASFLYLERPGAPMHVGALSILDSSERRQGPISMPEVRSRLLIAFERDARFRRRVVFPRFGLGRPEWRDAGPIDWTHHLAHHRLRHGSDRELWSLAGRLHQAPLDRARPLWQAHLIDGLHGGRQALLLKTHHAIGDGLEGIGVARELFEGDFSEMPQLRVDSGRGAGWFRALQAAGGFLQYVLGGPFAEAAATNGHVGAGRDFAATALPRREMAAVRLALGGTVDDVLLAAVALALQELNAEPRRRSLRAMVPASRRPATATGPHGNQVSSLFLDLPLDLEPEECVAAIAAQKATLRTGHEALGVAALVEMAGRLPPPLFAAATVIGASAQIANLVVSDIPGPAGRFSFLGAPVVAVYPLMPLAPASGLSVAAVWLGDVVGVGITTDPTVFAGGGRLANAVRHSLTRLLASARNKEVALRDLSSQVEASSLLGSRLLGVSAS